MGHRQGEGRTQTTLFPLMLDEMVPSDAMVRVIDSWVGSLDLVRLKFNKARALRRGAPPYSPADLLKLYVWGYLNAVRSSRELEKQCHRDVECMWLLGRLAPDHKTIANFRRDNAAALVATCAKFVEFACRHGVVGGKTVAVDGSKVRAVASRKAVTGQRDLTEQARQNALQIAAYLKLLDEGDEQERGEHRPRPEDVRRALTGLEQEREKIQAELEELVQKRQSRKVMTEPDARVMPSLMNAPGYNLQTAVDTDSHLIVTHAVVNDHSDQRQLQPMTEAAAEVLGELQNVIADTGYSNGEQIANVEASGITPFVGIKRSGNSSGDGQSFDRTAFVYDPAADCFTCPAGNILKRQSLNEPDKQVTYRARPADCAACEQKPHCTRSNARSVARHVHEDALAACAARLERHPEVMRLRRQVVEHPFAFIKDRVLANARLLLRGLQGARAELSLAVLAYNVKRVFNMKGAAWMRQAMQG